MLNLFGTKPWHVNMPKIRKGLILKSRGCNFIEGLLEDRLKILAVSKVKDSDRRDNPPARLWCGYNTANQLADNSECPRTTRSIERVDDECPRRSPAPIR